MDNTASTANVTTPPESLDPTRVYHHPSMSQESLQRAKSSFASTSSGEKSVIFIDTAPRGFMQRVSSGRAFARPGSTGLLVTDQAIYDGSIWENDRFLPDRNKRAIPLQRITDIRVGEWFGQQKRLMVNHIPLFGQHPPSFAGVDDPALLHWCSKQLATLVSQATAGNPPSLKDVVLSYQSFLVSERPVLGKGDLYYAGSIPPAYIVRAKSAYLDLGSKEEVLFFYNDGRKGEGGVVLTDRSLYSHECGSDLSFKWPLSSISRVWVGAYKRSRTTYLYVVVNLQRVYGWPHRSQSQSGGWSVGGILRPAFALAGLICQAVAASGGPQLSMPTTWTDLGKSEVNFRVSEGW